MNFFKKLQNIGIRNAIKVGISSAKQSKIFKIFFLVNWIFGKWVFKKPPKKEKLLCSMQQKQWSDAVINSGVKPNKKLHILH